MLTHLRGTIAASAAAVNGTRYTRILAELTGPYVVPASGGWLGLGDLPDGTSTGWWPFAAGSYTAQQIADVLNGPPAEGILGAQPVASSVSGRLELRSFLPASAVELPIFIMPGKPDSATAESVNLNSVFGWSSDGEQAQSARAIVAPNARGICDGYPMTAPDMGQGFWVIVGDRKAEPAGGSSLRRDSWDVALELHIARPTPADERHRTREPIAACLEAVSAALLTTNGRQLGRAAEGDVQLVEIVGEEIHGSAIQFEEVRNVLFDTATLRLVIRVFQRPASS